MLVGLLVYCHALLVLFEEDPVFGCPLVPLPEICDYTLKLILPESFLIKLGRKLKVFGQVMVDFDPDIEIPDESVVSSEVDLLMQFPLLLKKGKQIQVPA